MAVSATALFTGYLAAAYGMRPAPFYPGLLFAVLGLILSAVFVRDTQAHAQLEAALEVKAASSDNPVEASFWEVFARTSWKDRALFAASQAGMVNNLNDGLVWGLVPLYLAGGGLSVAQVGAVAATYPAVWGVGQLASGALSDRLGRKWLIAIGMWIQALGIALFVIGRGLTVWMSAAVLLGLGTALVYPTLLAAISDVANPTWRGTSVGVYRLWRDGGFAVGGLTAGLLADAFGTPFAIGAISILTFFSGILVAGVMYETLPSRRLDQPNL